MTGAVEAGAEEQEQRSRSRGAGAEKQEQRSRSRGAGEVRGSKHVRTRSSCLEEETVLKWYNTKYIYLSSVKLMEL